MVQTKNMNLGTYALTAADVTAGSLQFEFEYTNGTVMNPNAQNQCIDRVGATALINMFIAPPPTCTIAPPSQTICAGGSATFTVTPVGTGPFTISWTGPNGFTAGNTNAIHITNATASNAGTYTATVRDAFGCPTTCSGTLIVNPLPTCSITGPNPVCTATTNTYTSTATAGSTHSWSISGNGTIIGSLTGSSVTVVAGAAGSFTLTDNILLNGCPGSCTLTVTVNPLPTCNITGPSPVACVSTNTYSVSVTPSDGTITYLWSITGNGTIIGSNTGSTVTVGVNSVAGGSFTLTVAIVRNGCPGSCNTTVQITPCPPPCIAVNKLVACYLGNNNCGTFSKFATGVQGTLLDGTVEVPAFCYAITVSNCSTTVTLTNVTVVDDRYPDVSAADFSCITGGSLAPRASCTFMFRATVGTTDDIVTFVTNTVTASGQSSQTGVGVSASSQSAVEVVPAKVACQKFYTVDGGPATNDFTISDALPHTIVWYLTITNTGVANLLDLTITDVATGPGCNNAFAMRELDRGTSITFAICTNASFVCSNGVSSGVQDTVTVVAHAFTLGTNTALLCATTILGTNITASSECSATLLCTTPMACRVTGGGRQDLNDGGEVCPADAAYVTHGGQVGAPVGDRICIVLTNFTLGNPCIHGRWTHIRHGSGGDGREGSFHARFFDTLDCACLGTNLDANCHYTAGTVVNGICNDHDRCLGPYPRRAPANKIAFTGVGDWTCEKGGRIPRSCLFRVDIEDRGEPGNDHTLDLGHKPCRIPDRYRIRIWVLTETELAELNGAGPDPFLLHFRNCISACNGIDYQDGLCGPNHCSGDTCTGAGTTGTITFPGGCPVPTPTIDDGGELLHGNHQIHPSIKACDPFNPVGPPLPKP
jgi:hypothetical protein